MRRSQTLWLAVLLTAFSQSPTPFAQEIVLPKSVQEQQHKIPDSVLYGVLFRQAAAFTAKADEMDEAGQDGSPWRKHLAHKLNLTPTEELYLEQAGLEYDLQVRPIDEEIADSARRFRQAIGIVTPGHVPPLPPEAAYLLSNRDAAIEAIRDGFHLWLGDSEFARVDALMKTRLAKDVTVTNVHAAKEGGR